LLDFVYFLTEPDVTIDNSPGLASQILDRVRVQIASGLSIGMVVAVADFERFDERVAPVLNEAGIPFARVQVNRFPFRLFSAAKTLRRFTRQLGTRYVYVRDMPSSLVHQLAFPFGGPQLLYDMRGDAAAEARFRGTSALKRWVLDRLISRAIRHADRHAGVSTFAASLMEKQFGAVDVNVVPSCVDASHFEAGLSERTTIRDSLGLADDDVLVVYSGGSQHYQMLPQMLRLWEAMAEDDSIHYLLLTHGQDSGVNSAIKAVNLPRDRFHHMALDRAQIPGYLNASDIGFLLRELHQLNTVASPIKFGEYLASGLSVVSSPGIGDVSQLIDQRELGILVDGENTGSAVTAVKLLIQDVRNNPEAHAERSRRAARDTYNWGAHINGWKEMLPD